MSAAIQPVACAEISLRIGQRVRHQDYQGKRVTGIVRGLTVDHEQGLMVDCALDAPLILPACDYMPEEVRIHRQYAQAHEFTPFDDRDELIAEMLAALQGMVRVADRATVEFDAARAVIAKATGSAA
jgi:hypothetical protein